MFTKAKSLNFVSVNKHKLKVTTVEPLYYGHPRDHM